MCNYILAISKAMPHCLQMTFYSEMPCLCLHVINQISDRGNILKNLGFSSKTSHHCPPDPSSKNSPHEFSGQESKFLMAESFENLEITIKTYYFLSALHRHLETLSLPPG